MPTRKTEPAQGSQCCALPKCSSGEPCVLASPLRHGPAGWQVVRVGCSGLWRPIWIPLAISWTRTTWRGLIAPIEKARGSPTPGSLWGLGARSLPVRFPLPGPAGTLNAMGSRAGPQLGREARVDQMLQRLGAQSEPDLGSNPGSATLELEPSRQGVSGSLTSSAELSCLPRKPPTLLLYNVGSSCHQAV